MHRNIVKTIFIGFLLTSSCSNGPVPIAYGADECGECRMKISDHRFGAELITKKGKVKKYDSVECLVAYVLKNDEQTIGNIYVVDYSNPKTLIAGEAAGYLISKQIPSPMGGYISSYETMDKARTQKAKKDGQVFTWENLKNYLEK